jgi:hypothetical protein
VMLSEVFHPAQTEPHELDFIALLGQNHFLLRCTLGCVNGLVETWELMPTVNNLSAFTL